MTPTRPRVIGYIPLLYGKEYLRECILSMLPFVDKLYIFYVSEPSQGHASNIPCPETWFELFEVLNQLKFDLDICKSGNADKIEWVDSKCGTEHEHRELILNYSNGYDLILTLDADEVIDGRDIQQALDTAYKGHQRYWGIDGFINFLLNFFQIYAY